MSKKKIIIIGVLIVLSFILFTVFKGDSAEETEGLVSSGRPGASGPQVGAEILSALNTLDTLKLDTTFFQNDIFRKLKDNTKPVPTQPVSRSNPFAPIGVGGSALTSTSSAAVPPPSAPAPATRPIE